MLVCNFCGQPLDTAGDCNNLKCSREINYINDSITVLVVGRQRLTDKLNELKQMVHDLREELLEL